MRNGHVDSSDIRYVPSEAAKAINRYRIFTDDIYISVAGTLGLVGAIPSDLNGANLTENADRITNISCSRRYLLHVLLSPIVQGIIDGVRTVGAQPKLALTRIRKFPIPLPPTEREQNAIADALSDADALIQSLQALVDKKQAIKQGAMQQLLSGKRRLPGFSSPWTQLTLGDVLTFKNGLNKAKSYFGFGTPIVNYMDVFTAPRIFSTTLTGRVSLSPAEIRNFDVRRGDIFFTRTSETQDEIGMAAVIVDQPVETVFSGFILRGRPKNDLLDSDFAAYYLRSYAVRQQVVSKASYTTRALTNGRILSNVSITLPEKHEQSAIASILCDMDSEIAVLESQLAKFRDIKRGMMQELLTGRVRLT